MQWQIPSIPKENWYCRKMYSDLYLWGTNNTIKALKNRQLKNYFFEKINHIFLYMFDMSQKIMVHQSFEGCNLWLLLKEGRSKKDGWPVALGTNPFKLEFKQNWNISRKCHFDIQLRILLSTEDKSNWTFFYLTGMSSSWYIYLNRSDQPWSPVPRSKKKAGNN